MPRFIIIILLCAAPLFVSAPDNIMAAAKMSFIQNLFRHSDEVMKLGRQAGKITAEQMNNMIRRFPELARKSRELIRGAAAIEQAAQKSPAAARLIEHGLNPARIAIAAERHPERVKLGNEIAEMFAMAKPAQNLGNLPPAAITAVKNLDGNYTKAGESFFEMARKGGKGAVNIAAKLYDAATPGKVTATAALALLAWHMADPAGAEQAVQDFFSNHVEPVVAAPVKGMLDGTANTIDTSLDTATDKISEIASRHWGWLIVGLLACLFLAVPNLRRLSVAILDNYCGNLIKKISSRGHASALDIGQKPEAWQTAAPKRRINIYRKK